VNEADETGCTALILASQDGHVEVVRLLLARKGVEVNKSAQNGATALMVASQSGHVKVVRLLLARQDVEVNKTAQNGGAALIVYSENCLHPPTSQMFFRKCNKPKNCKAFSCRGWVLFLHQQVKCFSFRKCNNKPKNCKAFSCRGVLFLHAPTSNATNLRIVRPSLVGGLFLHHKSNVFHKSMFFRKCNKPKNCKAFTCRGVLFQTVTVIASPWWSAFALLGTGVSTAWDGRSGLRWWGAATRPTAAPASALALLGTGCRALATVKAALVGGSPCPCSGTGAGPTRYRVSSSQRS
jgi:hypothetical protein